MTGRPKINLTRHAPGPVATPPPSRDEINATAIRTGFDRDLDADQRQAPRHATGRNTQLNVRLRPEDVAMLRAICDANRWPLGEGLERALALLAEKHPLD